ncbi:MAG: hypothetical protein M8467_18200 [Anaerolineae bacterium]|nr:hypothetical protein [Anaerolineae bacterium]
MVRRVGVVMFLAVLSLVVAIPVALADQPDMVGGLGNSSPNFGPGVYADGVAWGTKGTTFLPAPNEDNQQSFDALYVFTNGVAGQLPVSEAGPGNPMYNGGRWFTHTVTWADPSAAVLITSYAELMAHMAELEITEGSPEGGPPAYFQCPLLPVK